MKHSQGYKHFVILNFLTLFCGSSHDMVAQIKIVAQPVFISRDIVCLKQALCSPQAYIHNKNYNIYIHNKKSNYCKLQHNITFRNKITVLLPWFSIEQNNIQLHSLALTLTLEAESCF